MTWLVDSFDTTPPGDRMARLWARPEILRMPGAHHALAGILAKRAGFEALYVSGSAIASVLGLPDLGIVSREEVLFFVQRIYRATNLPLLVDCDTGFGESLVLIRTVREMEDAGAAAIQLEDQVMPKKCGHLSDKKLVDAREMASRIASARAARRSLRIMARTDAVAQEGLDQAIARARLYVEAGADAVFPEALTDEDMFRRFAREVEVPLLANMTEFGLTPHFTAQQFEDFGFKMVIWPATSLRAAAKTLADLYGTLAAEGTAQSFLPRLQTRTENYDALRHFEYEAMDKSLVRSRLPGED